MKSVIVILAILAISQAANLPPVPNASFPFGPYQLSNWTCNTASNCLPKAINISSPNNQTNTLTFQYFWPQMNETSNACANQGSDLLTTIDSVTSGYYVANSINGSALIWDNQNAPSTQYVLQGNYLNQTSWWSLSSQTNVPQATYIQQPITAAPLGTFSFTQYAPGSSGCKCVPTSITVANSTGGFYQLSYTFPSNTNCTTINAAFTASTVADTATSTQVVNPTIGSPSFSVGSAGSPIASPTYPTYWTFYGGYSTTVAGPGQANFTWTLTGGSASTQTSCAAQYVIAPTPSSTGTFVYVNYTGSAPGTANAVVPYYINIANASGVLTASYYWAASGSLYNTSTQQTNQGWINNPQVDNITGGIYTVYNSTYSLGIFQDNQVNRPPVTLITIVNPNITSSYYWIWSAQIGCYANYAFQPNGLTAIPGIQGINGISGAEKLVATVFALLTLLISSF